MLLPGYVTDAIGILCFVPVLRTIIGGNIILSRFQIARMPNIFTSGFPGNFSAGPGPDFLAGQNYDDSQIRNPDHDPRQAPRTRRQNTLDGDIIEGDFEQKD